MNLLYFAWIRERIGLNEEQVTLPPHVASVAQLIDWLAARGEGYEKAFKDRKLIKVARDQEHVAHNAPVAGAREIAFFPPVTGG